jgi:hypothetical protein
MVRWPDNTCLTGKFGVMADRGTAGNANLGHNYAVFTDTHPVPDENTILNDRIRTNRHVIANGYKRTYKNPIAGLQATARGGHFTDTRRRLNRRMEQLHNFGKCQLGVAYTDQVFPRGLESRGDENGPGSRVVDPL